MRVLRCYLSSLPFSAYKEDGMTTPQTAHTPGPWSAHQRTVRMYHLQGYPIGSDPLGGATVAVTSASIAGDAQANARLIAAAPDLLAAAQAVSRAMEEEEFEGYVPVTEHEELHSRLDAAIAKAKGEA